MQYSLKACRAVPSGFVYHHQTKWRVEFQYVGEEPSYQSPLLMPFPLQFFRGFLNLKGQLSIFQIQE